MTIKTIQRIVNVFLATIYTEYPLLVVDGITGPKTRAGIDLLQKHLKLPRTGEWDSRTEQYAEATFWQGKGKFVVFLDAGHGGIDWKAKYTTPGKRATHENYKGHIDNHFYEGHNNRLQAESLAQELTQYGILCIRTYHPYLDVPLRERTQLMKDWLSKGYTGVMISIHSNAIGSSYPYPDSVRGFSTHIPKAKDSDNEKLANYIQDTCSPIMYKDRGIKRDNFSVMVSNLVNRYNDFATALIEMDFHTSKPACEFLSDKRETIFRSELLTMAIKHFKNDKAND